MTTPQTESAGLSIQAEATRKTFRYLLPIMVGIYFLSFIDRTNVALAKQAFEVDLGISAAAYGLGAGLFFIGYALLEVPSNLIAYRVGPRRWIARIAISWGTVSALMMFVQGEYSFYFLRLLLGVCEAGLFPALMYVMTLWYAQEDRSTAVGWLYLAPALGLIIGNPIGGALMQLDGLMGLTGWQWMFLLEGLPTVIFGLFILAKFPDSPRDAAWLTPEEAAVIERRASGGSPHTPSKEWLSVLKYPTTILMGLVYFFNQVGFVGLYFFAPSMVQQMNVSNTFIVGLLSSTVGIGFMLGVLVLPRLHRRARNDFWFMGAATVGLIIAASVVVMGPPIQIQLLFFIFTAFFAGGILPIYWSVSMRRLRGIQAAAGLAFINTIGLLGGFTGPYLFGIIERQTGSSASGFSIIVVTAVIGLILIPFLARAFDAADKRAELEGAPA